ncbi:MAG: Gfo/Idh/MocA family oxidoreductase [Planctomycetia bacterium]|nr:Gfo/Idh/MocA family oxidoreductase [Planctomycetia bacterium]
MNEVRIAVIGVGHLGRIHAKLLAGVPGARLVAVVDPSEANRTQAAAETGAEPFADFRSVIGRIDAAVIATPTRYHHAVAAELLGAGIHVLVEKPLAPTAAECAELVELADRHGAILQVGHVERFNPAWEHALVRAGEPKFITANRTSGYSFRSTDIGAVLDLMIHDIDLALWLTKSRVVHVEALGIALFGREEDAAHARLVFENGCVAVLSACRASYSAARTFQFWSRRSQVSVDLGQRITEIIRPSEAILRRELNLATLRPDQIGTAKESLLAEHLPRTTHTAPAGNPLQDELKEFVRCVQTGAEPSVSGAAGLAAVEVAERILDKIAEHAWDGQPAGLVGATAVASPAVLPGPHWRLKTSLDTVKFERRDAG